MFMLIILTLLLGSLVLNSIRWIKEEGNYWTRVLLILLSIGIILTIMSIFWQSKILLLVIFAVALGVLITSIGSIILHTSSFLGILSVVMSAILVIIMLYPLLSKNAMWSVGKAKQFWTESKERWNRMITPRSSMVTNNIFENETNSDLFESVTSSNLYKNEPYNNMVDGEFFQTNDEEFAIPEDDYAREIDNIFENPSNKPTNMLESIGGTRMPIQNEQEEEEDTFYDAEELPSVTTTTSGGMVEIPID